MKLSSKLLPSIFFFFFNLFITLNRTNYQKTFSACTLVSTEVLHPDFPGYSIQCLPSHRNLGQYKDAQAMRPSMKYLTRGLQDYSFSSTLKQRENENMEGNILDSNPLLSFVHPFPVYLFCFNIIAGTNQMFSTHQQVHSSLAFLCLLRSLLYTVVQYIRSRMQNDS